MQENSGKNMITLKKYASLRDAVKEAQKVRYLVAWFQKHFFLIGVVGSCRELKCQRCHFMKQKG